MWNKEYKSNPCLFNRSVTSGFISWLPGCRSTRRLWDCCGATEAMQLQLCGQMTPELHNADMSGQEYRSKTMTIQTCSTGHRDRNFMVLPHPVWVCLFSFSSVGMDTRRDSCTHMIPMIHRDSGTELQVLWLERGVWNNECNQIWKFSIQGK